MNTYKHIVIEGSGVNGIVFCGALTELEKQGALSELTHFAGSSSGGFIATMLALRFTPAQISAFLSLDTFKALTPPSYLRQVYNFVVHRGLMSIQGARRVFEDLLKKNNLDPNMTFQDLFVATGHTLVLTVTDLQSQEAVYINRFHHPDVKVVDAAMATVSIPLLYMPQKYTFDSSIGPRYYIDGGLTDNYPLWIFSNDTMLCRGDYVGLRSLSIPTETLGLLLHETPPQKAEPKQLWSYLSAVFSVLRSKYDSYYTTTSFERQTVDIVLTDSNFIGDFGLTQDEWNRLFRVGQDAVFQFMSLLNVSVTFDTEHSTSQN